MEEQGMYSSSRQRAGIFYIACEHISSQVLHPVFVLFAWVCIKRKNIAIEHVGTYLEVFPEENFGNNGKFTSSVLKIKCLTSVALFLHINKLVARMPFEYKIITRNFFKLVTESPNLVPPIKYYQNIAIANRYVSISYVLIKAIWHMAALLYGNIKLTLFLLLRSNSSLGGLSSKLFTIGDSTKSKITFSCDFSFFIKIGRTFFIRFGWKKRKHTYIQAG